MPSTRDSRTLLALTLATVAFCLGLTATLAGIGWVGGLAGAAGVAGSLAGYRYGRTLARSELEVATQARQIDQLESAMAEQLQARMAAEDSVRRLGEELGRAERQRAVAAERNDDPAPAPAVILPEVALTDPVTGLYGEAYFRVAVESRIAAARRHLRPVGVVLLEMVEDVHTSARPANPLAVAEAITMTLREADTACRLTDGRFGLVLEDTPETGAIWTVERIRRQIADAYPGVTLWAGVACYPAHAFDRDGLLSLATRALITAKDWRQDRIEVASTDDR